jgi:hypothetical protein
MRALRPGLLIFLHLIILLMFSGGYTLWSKVMSEFNFYSYISTLTTIELQIFISVISANEKNKSPSQKYICNYTMFKYNSQYSRFFSRKCVTSYNMQTISSKSNGLQRRPETRKVTDDNLNIIFTFWSLTHRLGQD